MTGPAKRDQLRARDRDACWWCFKSMDFSGTARATQKPTIEHLHPKALGGGNELDNLVLCHPGCNKQLADRPRSGCAPGDCGSSLPSPLPRRWSAARPPFVQLSRERRRLPGAARTGSAWPSSPPPPRPSLPASRSEWGLGEDRIGRVTLRRAPKRGPGQESDIAPVNAFEQTD